jgi:hypothetical protein
MKLYLGKIHSLSKSLRGSLKDLDLGSEQDIDTFVEFDYSPIQHRQLLKAYERDEIVTIVLDNKNTLSVIYQCSHIEV